MVSYFVCREQVELFASKVYTTLACKFTYFPNGLSFLPIGLQGTSLTRLAKKKSRLGKDRISLNLKTNCNERIFDELVVKNPLNTFGETNLLRPLNRCGKTCPKVGLTLFPAVKIYLDQAQYLKNSFTFTRNCSFLRRLISTSIPSLITTVPPSPRMYSFICIRLIKKDLCTRRKIVSASSLS